MSRPRPPKTEAEYRDHANALARSFAPDIRACKKCGWPVVSGYCCTYCGDANPSEREDDDDTN
jgi:hypothetical protein